ncbi:hypothetical protein A6A05_18255 [Magnetospirillum moscoviense]|uniref:Uncharacterized protein n=1 Tax=Magnetospirillum moscoviense TaxID=1437059 RepID=A0A178N1W2_9PROT|nr:hypothetical protein [Magnetospirillum moscoviense]OAN67323.1 hypothetical protein A6A05_18255 [Magnetospirillum moscoviense]
MDRQGDGNRGRNTLQHRQLLFQQQAVAAEMDIHAGLGHQVQALFQPRMQEGFAEMVQGQSVLAGLLGDVDTAGQGLLGHVALGPLHARMRAIAAFHVAVTGQLDLKNPKGNRFHINTSSRIQRRRWSSKKTSDASILPLLGVRIHRREMKTARRVSPAGRLGFGDSYAAFARPATSSTMSPMMAVMS